MKKMLMTLTVFVLGMVFVGSSNVMAGGDKNRGEIGQGDTYEYNCEDQPCFEDAPMPGPTTLRTSAAPSEEFTIVVAPNVLNLQSHSKWVTIHTNLPYLEFTCDEFTLDIFDNYGQVGNSVPPALDGCFADNLGYLVVKFTMEDVKGVLDEYEYETLPEFMTFTLTVSDETAASDTIKIINVGPAGKAGGWI